MQSSQLSMAPLASCKGCESFLLLFKFQPASAQEQGLHACWCLTDSSTPSIALSVPQGCPKQLINGDRQLPRNDRRGLLKLLARCTSQGHEPGPLCSALHSTQRCTKCGKASSYSIPQPQGRQTAQAAARLSSAVQRLAHMVLVIPGTVTRSNTQRSTPIWKLHDHQVCFNEAGAVQYSCQADSMERIACRCPRLFMCCCCS